MTPLRKGGNAHKGTDWMPSSREGVFKLSDLINDYLNNTAIRIRIGLGPTTEQGKWFDNVFLEHRSSYALDFMMWSDPTKRTIAVIQKIRGSEKEIKGSLRTLYTGFFVKSPLVTDEDLVSMGFPARSGGRHTPVPVPATVPVLRITHPANGVVRISFKDSESASRAKPFGVHGIEILWGVLTEPPKTHADLTNSSFATRSPLNLEFEQTDFGKTIYMVARWENTRAEKGNWSKSYNEVIS
jgi:hypothetical protein